MTESVGGVAYDEAASLKYGELFEELLPKEEAEKLTDKVKARISKDVELILVSEEEDESEDGLKGDTGQNKEVILQESDEDEIQYTKKELEARAVAKRIKEIIDPDKGLLLIDKDEEGNIIHRPAKLKDIVILLRTMTGWADVFVNTLMQEGIPAYADTGTGYFQTSEIMTL